MDEPVSMTHFDPKEGVLIISGREFKATDDIRVWASEDYYLRLRDDLAWDLYRDDRRIHRGSLDSMVPFMPVQG